MKTFMLVIAAAMPAFAYAQANTPPAPPARGPALELALEAARTAVETCSARQQKVSVSVVDSAGVLKALLASDGAHARGVASSTSKALTSLAFGSATSQLGEQAKTDQALANKLAANNAYNARGGGLAIAVAGTVIGAIGVGGARGSDVDEACAQAGLSRIQDRLQ